MSLKDDLLTFAPDMNTEDEAKVDLCLSWAERSVNKRVFGAKSDQAIILLAAHFIAASSGTVGGQVTSEQLGELSTSYAGPAVSPSDSDLATTSYGLLFLGLRRTVMRSPLVI